MTNLTKLAAEINCGIQDKKSTAAIFLAQGFSEHYDDENVIARAYAIKNLFEAYPKHLYDHDLVAGSMRGLIAEEQDREALCRAERILQSFGFRYFQTNSDHYAPNYATFLKNGICGTLTNIQASQKRHESDNDAKKKLSFLKAAEITICALQTMIRQYGDVASAKKMTNLAATCYAVAEAPPKTFREAIQLTWFVHLGFLCEGRKAMAFGRMDQYLYPYYRADLESGILTREEALELVACTFYKIHENWYFGGDDVENIVIGGVKPEDGSDAVNELSYVILEAVERCQIPGPNLSARISQHTPDAFLDRCLEVIGTGIGYPALMNDDVNIPALQAHGYSLEDCRNYCMVGCIENFIQGKQPPWSDGRYNSPKYIELALNDGKCMLTGQQLGPHTGDAVSFTTMDQFMAALEEQMRYGTAEYMAFFRNENERYKAENYMQPYLSCFCDDCIGRGLDINDGGAIYPSVHGAGLMGIATVSDSLAAVEKVVYQDQDITLSELRDALLVDFSGYEALRNRLLSAPKYGNNDDFVDKYAIWFVDFQNQLFSHYKTHDGGDIYIAIASNISNIPAGLEIAATPDGRHACQPVSDAASPMHGMDKHGPTAALSSLAKPDYTQVACGTVVNQKYSPDIFSDQEKRSKLGALIRTYFAKGGQEIQINSVSRHILADAMHHPEQYRNLVVRVSGFSAYYILLSKEVQLDILKRTEHA